MTTKPPVTFVLVGVLVWAAAADAQQPAPARAQHVQVRPATPVGVIEAVPLDTMARVKDAPFSAQAVTEFTQTLGDGNRIERRYDSFIARDSRGRTRREEEIAMIGPIGSATGPPPRLVTILDPDAGVTFTLNEESRVAHRNRMPQVHGLMHVSRDRTHVVAELSTSPGSGRHAVAVHTTPHVAPPVGASPRVNARESTVTEDLGTSTIEGVAATGTRTTTTIPAGSIGNLLPIEIVSERWFSQELQMPVLITRRDPRSGDTVYRLTNISRAEPPADLFTVPPGFEVQEGRLGPHYVITAPKPF